MGTAFSSEAAKRRPPGGGGKSTRALTAASQRAAGASTLVDPRAAAWVAVLPTAAVVVVAMLLLGAPLGRLLFSASSARFWPGAVPLVAPEPTEQARFLIALSTPLLLAGITAWVARRARLAPRQAALLAGASEAIALLALVACVVAQRLQAPQNYTGDRTPVVYFTLPSLLAAVAIAAALALAMRSDAVRTRGAALLADSRGRRIGALAVAAVAIVVLLLPAIETDRSIAHAYPIVSYHLAFTYDETMAVVDGRSPLANYVTQYASLWPYLVAAAMSVVGTGLAAFTGLMAGLTSLTLLALYDVLRRVARSSIAGLLLFLPLLATCGFRLHGPAVHRFSLANYFGVMPLRYAGPFLLAWLVARHLDGARPRRVWPLFLVAGLAALNNVDFGLAALGATVAALAWTRTRAEERSLRRNVCEAAAGLAGALAFVTALVLARTGSPPDLTLLFRYSRIFATDGFAMLPIRPLFGFPIVIFSTYVATIGLATVRALRGEDDRLLTGMLAWSGVFGLGAGSYYVGHSLSEVLIYTFPCWGLSVTLLTLATIRALARATRLPAASELACLVAFGLLVCSLAQLPAPWQQVSRISADGPTVFAHPLGEGFVARYAAPGESVLIVGRLGHRIAANQGLDDVEPYSAVKSIFTVEQLADSLRALRDAGGTKVFLEPLNAYGNLASVLERRFAPRDEGESLQLWVAR